MEKQPKGLAILSCVLAIIALVCIFGWYMNAASNSGKTDQFNQAKTDLSAANSNLKICQADLSIANSKTCPTAEISTSLVDLSAVKAKAIKDFLESYEDDENYTCDGSEYDFDQISVSSVSKDWTYEQIDAEEYAVSFTAKLKFSDKDVEEKCYQKLDVEVSYPNDKDADVDVEYAIA